MKIRRLALIVLVQLTLLNCWAAELKLNIGVSEPTTENLNTFMQYKMTKKTAPTNEAVKSEFLKTMLFANAYHAKHFTKEDLKNLELQIDEILAEKYKNILMKKQEIKIDEEVLQSFYVAHKSNYILPETIDLYQVTFEKKEDAEKFSKSEFSDKLLRDNVKNTLAVPSVDPRLIPPLYKLYLGDLKEKRFSEVITNVDENKSTVIFVMNKIPSRVYSYEEAKPYIKNYLVNKKSDEFILNELEKLKKENK